RVQQLLQLAARLEVGDALGRHRDRLSGLRVPALARVPLADAEAAEAAELDLLAPLERVHDALEEDVDDGLRVLAREVRDARDLVDQLRLGHRAFFPSLHTPPLADGMV